MKNALIALACLAALTAHATGKPPSPNPTQSQHVGITTVSVAAAAAASYARGGSAWATGGAGGIGQGGQGGSIGSVMAGGVDLGGARIGSDVMVERSAPSLYGATPTQPTQPCARPGFSIGGSSRDGSGLLSIPTGTDVTCRVDNALTIMARNPALFTADDRLKVSCKQEDIAETATCKALAEREERKTAAAPANVTASNKLELLP